MSFTGTYECSICFEPCIGDHIYISVESEDVICTECFTTHIQPQFEEALRFEHSYPVKWGTEELDPMNFAQVLPDGFVMQWICKENEYETPIDRRVYCQHQVAALREQSFMGLGKAISSDKAKMVGIDTRSCGKFLGSNDGRGVHVCFQCGGLSCSECGTAFFGEDSGERSGHLCKTSKAALHIDRAFEGLMKGRDFQLCSNAECRLKVSLADGCNEICCHRCSEHFCFLCGKKTEHGDDHWSVGSSCPRYNQPGSEHAVFDGEEEDDAEATENIEFLLDFDTLLRANTAPLTLHHVLLLRTLAADIHRASGGDLSDDMYDLISIMKVLHNTIIEQNMILFVISHQVLLDYLDEFLDDFLDHYLNNYEYITTEAEADVTTEAWQIYPQVQNTLVFLKESQEAFLNKVSERRAVRTAGLN